MKITNIEYQKNNINRVNIYVDNVFSIGIDLELKFKYNLEVGLEVDDEFITRVIQAEESIKAKNHALNLLSYRQRTEKEIRDSLLRKGYNEESINNAVDFCIKYNYIDDKKFAESFLKDKINLNKLGPERIKYELRLKGVDKDIIEDVLYVKYDDQFEMARDLAFKKISSYKNDDRNAQYRKLSGFLQRKGYSYGVISKVLKDVLQD